MKHIATFTALNRFGLGPAPGDAQAAEPDPRGWLKSQIRSGAALREALLLIPAATTRYRDRSHFDGQNLLENGSGKPFGAADGWLNRAIASLQGDGGDRRLGLALGPAVPLILQGDARVQAWARSRLPQVDEDFLVRLGLSYAHDTLFARTLQDARGSLKPVPDSAAMSGQLRPADEFLRSATAAADLLARPGGRPMAGPVRQGPARRPRPAAGQRLRGPAKEPAR